ncbi:MAG TPA: hypothetical protein DEP57_07165 [Selenomonas sp.]|nr:hypothetical protein [Selenomonas sp.]
MAEFKWNGKNGANLEGTEDADWLRLDGCYDCKVFGYGGDDTVRITDCSYTILYAGDGDNDIDWKGSKYCSISSGAGNDTINVWLYGGTGYHILCGAGNDSVWGCDGIDYIYGGADNDSLDGDANNDYIYGEAGDDIIWGGDEYGDDHLYGGAGNDTILAGNGDDWIWGDADDLDVSMHGVDILYGDTGNDSILGGAGDDSLGGGSGADVIYGGAGNDSLWGTYGDYDDGDMDIYVFFAGDGPQVDVIMDFESGCDGIWVPDAAFTKAEIHGDDLWAYVGDDRGVIIKNAVGKELKYFDASCTEIKTCKL